MMSPDRFDLLRSRGTLVKTIFICAMVGTITKGGDMAGLVRPGGATSPVREASRNHLESLEIAVRNALSLDADAAVLIQQLTCSEPGCPPMETVVAVLSTPRRTWKFADAAVHVTAADIHSTVVPHPEGHDHDHTNR